MKYVVANWKMNLSVRESVALVRGVLHAIQGREHIPGIVVCPSFTALAEVHKLVTRTHIKLGAQNAGPNRAGAFTGEVGITQLEDVGCEYAIIGHSERRSAFGESEALVHSRLSALLASGLTPVLCVGEPIEARKAGKEELYVLKQLKSALTDQKVPQGQQIMIAYEPIWAIGSGQPATPEQIVAMHKAIRAFLASEFRLAGDNVIVLYGGSTNGDNAHQFLREPEIDGLLVGGASLKIKDFEKILSAASEVMEAQT